MKEYQMKILLHEQPAALERLLRVIRHRGGSISAMTMVLNHHHIDLTLTLQTTKSFDTLYAQLNKLIDVESIEVI